MPGFDQARGMRCRERWRWDASLFRARLTVIVTFTADATKHKKAYKTPSWCAMFSSCHDDEAAIEGTTTNQRNARDARRGAEYATTINYEIVIVGCRPEYAGSNPGVLVRSDYKIGAILQPTREPENPHDGNAIALYGMSGKRVGYIKAVQARGLSQLVDAHVIEFTYVTIVSDVGHYLKGELSITAFPWKATDEQRDTLDRWTTRDARRRR